MEQFSDLDLDVDVGADADVDVDPPPARDTDYRRPGTHLIGLRNASEIGKAGGPMYDVALALVAGGWPVFPCGQDKAPLIGHGFKARSVDPEQVPRWWRTYPDAMPGLVPGD